jgi:glycosyltransferase involved in cell wall biosynthesis
MTAATEHGPRSPRVIALLPVRNGADALPGWLDAAATFADGVVALDDGSTDATVAILRGHPFVVDVVKNERRDGFLGWHDGRNRNRLLAAAARQFPDWVMSLDLDERLDPTDAAALRTFVATEALPGCAYGFSVFDMHAGETYDPVYEWVFRLFAFRPDQRFVNRRFDFPPVPVSIGPERWVKTSLRIKHYGAVDAVGREARVAKYREADPEGVFRDYYENFRQPAPGPFPPWRPRLMGSPVLVGANEPPEIQGFRPHVMALLPARDCAHLLPGWFESIARVADAVVALDDGSSDDTGRLLEAHPLVVSVLSNPVRPIGFAEWDDGANRNRLLATAAEYSPEWIISVDADERIPLEDAAALRRFLRFDAEAGCAYALASYRMIEDEDHYDRLDYDAYRLFTYEPGHIFPSDRLHAPPVPTSITQWRQTTIRMKHLVSLTEQDRAARREKFRQADPDFDWEPSYEYTHEQPGTVKRWEPRPLHLPVLVHGAAASLLEQLDLDGPVLTVVLRVDPGEEHEAISLLQAIAAADSEGLVEQLVTTRDGYAAGVIARSIDEVRVLELDPETSVAGARNQALAGARGDWVAFLDVGDRLLNGALDDLIHAHGGGHAVVCIEPAQSVGDGTTLSFARASLAAAGGFPDDGNEPGGSSVLASLLDQGLTATSISSVIRRPGTAPGTARRWRQRAAFRSSA